MNYTAICLLALPLLGASPNPVQECTLTCAPDLYVVTVAGSGWSLTVSDILIQGSAKPFCVTCTNCKCAYHFSFDGGFLNNDRYKYETDKGAVRGRGHTEGDLTGESTCDEIDPDVFEGFDDDGAGGWTSGVLLQLYCTCPS